MKAILLIALTLNYLRKQNPKSVLLLVYNLPSMSEVKQGDLITFLKHKAIRKNQGLNKKCFDFFTEHDIKINKNEKNPLPLIKKTITSFAEDLLNTKINFSV
jgi:hypothetical protein